MALRKITAFLCCCNVCQHEWITRIAPARCAKCKARTWNIVPARFRTLVEHIEKQKLALRVEQPRRRIFNIDSINKSHVEALLASLEAQLEPMAPEFAAAIRHRREAHQIDIKNSGWNPPSFILISLIEQLKAVETELRQGKPLPLEPHPRLLTEEEHREWREKFNQLKQEEAARVRARIEAREKREAKRKKVAL